MEKITYIICLLASISLISPIYAGKPNAIELFKAAKHEDDAKSYDKSLSIYLKADSAFIAENLAETEEYAKSLHNTGRAYFNTDNAEKGREYTLKAMKLREKLFGKVSKEYITSLNNYALSFFLSNDFNEAFKLQSEVINLCSKMNTPHPDEGMYLINLGRINYALGNESNAVKNIEDALGKVEKFSPNYEYALNFLANYYMRNDDNANTNRILGLMEEHNQHELTKECNTLDCHLERANYYETKGNTASARDEYMAAFALPLDNEEKATAYERYARFLSASLRDYAQAGDYYNMAAEHLAKVEGESEKTTSLYKQAGICFFVGKEYDKSIKAHQNVILMCDKHGYSKTLKGTSLQGLGNAYTGKKEYANAISAYKSWVKHLKDNGDEGTTDYAKAHERLASSEKFNGDYDASIADYETAIRLYNKLGMHEEEEYAANGLAMCKIYAKKNDAGNVADIAAANQQRHKKLQQLLKSELNTIEQSMGYLGRLSDARSFATVAGIYAQLSDYENSLKYYAQYINAIRDALSEDFLLKGPKERQLTWMGELKNINQMGTLITELPQNSPEMYAKLSNLIFEGQLLSKGILLSSGIEFGKVLNHYGTPEMKTKYDAIKQNISKIETLRKEGKSIDNILSLSRKTDAMQLELARECAQFAYFTDYLKIKSEDVANALDDNTAAVEFVTLDTGILSDFDMIIAVLISKDFPTGIAIPIGTKKTIKDIIADNEKFAKPEYGKLLWGGILQAAQGKSKIYFAPDGILNNIGIEYLNVEGSPLSDRIELSRVSSTKEICREHDSKPLQYAALFGNIDYMDYDLSAADESISNNRASSGFNFGDLDNTDREIKEITSLLKTHYTKSEIVPYTGTAASKTRFLSQEKLPINLLHIATHGKYIDATKVSDNDAMTRSVLAFAGANLYDNFENNAGLVNATEIADMTLQECDLVVLSACESGLGKLGVDGVFGLQRGFKNAGAKTLLVSLYEVSDNATADMMISFYRNYLTDANNSKREALRKAQMEIRNKYPTDNTWASFILIDSFD